MSPLFKTNRPVLDRDRPLELVLELLSFAGGENTIGEDVALKNNEARIIENWDALSMGGMIRSKGLNEVCAVNNIDDYDVLLVHCDGADGVTAWVDAANGAAISAIGTAQADTAQKKFGTASLLLDGNSDGISLLDSANWNFGAEDFTIDLQFRLNVDQDCVIAGQYVDANNYWHIKYDQVNSLLIFFWKDGGTDRADYEVAWNPAGATWYHLEVSRATTIMQMFIAGTKQTLTENTAIGATTLADLAAILIFGHQNAADYVDGWIDEIRVAKGVARHTASFTAPTEAYVFNDAPDLLLHHDESGSSRVYAIIAGDLVYKNGASFSVADAAGFTKDILSHGISAGNKAWITNSTDNLKYVTLAGALTTPADQPTNARDRIYHHKTRLFAEGGGKEVYGSKALPGNWTDADAWSLTNDAWDYTMPNYTYGAVMGFPSGHEITVFTYYQAHSLYNFPNIARRDIPNSHGCCAPYSIVKGDEGVYFLSKFPTFGIFLWNGIEWINLTENHDFIDDIDLTKRIFGIYRNRKYYFFYNESGSGVIYPNRLKIYNAKFGRWMTRPINAAVSDKFGIPELLRYDNNELYAASSKQGKLYELETTDNSDEEQNTEANYKTKDFSSRDFSLADGGGQFPIDGVRLKLIKQTITYYGTTGNLTFQWTADKGVRSGNRIITMSAEGALINVDFTVNVSKIVSSDSLSEKTKTYSFKNSAVGRRFNFQILNSATGERPKVKRIKIHAVALEES